MGRSETEGLPDARLTERDDSTSGLSEEGPRWSRRQACDEPRGRSQSVHRWKEVGGIENPAAGALVESDPEHHLKSVLGNHFRGARLRICGYLVWRPRFMRHVARTTHCTTALNGFLSFKLCAIPFHFGHTVSPIDTRRRHRGQESRHRKALCWHPSRTT